MYVISDEAIQDEIQGNGGKRDWVYSICSELLCNNPEQLTPPSASAFSEEWMKYQDNLKEHCLCGCRKSLETATQQERVEWREVFSFIKRKL